MLFRSKLADVTVPRRGQLIRVLYSEIGRILSHLLNVTTQAMDVGALTPPLWGFEEREKLMVFYERASGSRMHANYFRPGGVHEDLPERLVADIGAWCDPFLKVVDDLQALFIENRIFKQRNVDIGVVSLEDCWKWGFSGVMVRGSGAPWDLRKAQPYECYEEMEFDIPVGRTGDSYDRLWVLVQRMHESCRIIEQCLDRLPAGSYRVEKLPKKISLDGEIYVRTENPLGLMGYYVVGNGKKQPYRLKMRTASFSNVSVLPAMLPGTLVPDLISILGSIFFVVGDVDR